MSNLYTIFGSEKLLINKKIEEIEAKYKDYTYEKNVIDLEDESIISLLNEINTIPFLEDYRLVILRNPKFVYNEGSYDTRLVEAFNDFIDNPNDTTILITVVEKESKGVSYNKLKSKTNVFQIESIDPKKIDNLEDFVKEELERDGYKIANLALDELISRVNHDYNRIIIELEKLKIYKHEEKSISLDDVFLMVSKDLEDSVYPLVQAVLEKNKRKAMELYKSLKVNSIDETSILSSLISRFTELFQVKELVLAGYSKEKIAEAFQYKQGRVYYLMKDASGATLQMIKDNLNNLMDIDYGIKSGKVDKNVAIELYILKI